MAAELDTGLEIFHGSFENSLQDHLSRLSSGDLLELEQDICEVLRACADVAEAEQIDRFWFALGANVRPPQVHLETFLREILGKIQFYKSEGLPPGT
jgi:hypothetical protein